MLGTAVTKVPQGFDALRHRSSEAMPKVTGILSFDPM